MKRGKGVQRVLPGTAADRHIRCEQNKAKRKHQHKVNHQKQPPAILGAKIWKAPDIANADRTARRRQHKAKRTAETVVLFHQYTHFFRRF